MTEPQITSELVPYYLRGYGSPNLKPGDELSAAVASLTPDQNYFFALGWQDRREGKPARYSAPTAPGGSVVSLDSDAQYRAYLAGREAAKAGFDGIRSRIPEMYAALRQQFMLGVSDQRAGRPVPARIAQPIPGVLPSPAQAEAYSAGWVYADNRAGAVDPLTVQVPDEFADVAPWYRLGVADRGRGDPPRPDIVAQSSRPVPAEDPQTPAPVPPGGAPPAPSDDSGLVWGVGVGALAMLVLVMAARRSKGPKRG